MIRLLSAVAVAGILAMSPSLGLVDFPDREVTVSVIVPVTHPLTVNAGESFRTAAKDFISKHNLNAALAGNITKALEIRFEQMKLDTQPMLSVGVHVTSTTGQDSDEKTPKVMDLNLEIYEGDSIFDAVYRFCTRHGLDIYQHGKTLEGIVLDSLRNLAKRNEAVVNGNALGNAEMPRLDSEESPRVELTSATLPGGFKAAAMAVAREAEKVEGEADKNDDQQRFKLFSVPVRVDEHEVNLEFYNGDHLNEKISQFCETHNLNQSIAKQPLIDAVMNYTQAIQQKFPNSVWLESI